MYNEAVLIVDGLRVCIDREYFDEVFIADILKSNVTEHFEIVIEEVREEDVIVRFDEK
jgi:hypothetical protein